METIIIFTGGDHPDLDIVDDLPHADLIIAADSGYETAVGLGYRVDVLVGDMDSITTTPLPDHVIVERHSTDKDQTDLDLAIELAMREDPSRLVLVGGTGGRHDHELASTLLLGSRRWEGLDELDWFSSRSRIHVARTRRVIHGDIGSTLSLIPIGGEATGINTRGLKWELRDDTLPSGSTRGVSNVVVQPIVEVSLTTGCLLLVIPLS